MALSDQLDITPLLEDLRNRRALLLISDDQEYFIPDNALTGHMAEYHEKLPKFSVIARHYMDVVDIAYARSVEEEKNARNPEIYDCNKMKIMSSFIREGNMISGLPVDFRHPFNPVTDLYFPKVRNDNALGDGLLGEFIAEGGYRTVIMIGVNADACIPKTLQGLLGLRISGKSALKNIAVISDLADNNHGLTNVNLRPGNIMDRHALMRESLESIGRHTYLLSAQDVLSAWNPALNISHSMEYNRKIISLSQHRAAYAAVA